MRSLALLFAASVGLFACTPDTLDMTVITSETPVVHPQHEGAMAIAQGAAIAVEPSMDHEEVEGSSPLAVTRISSDDPATLEVLATSHFYFQESVSPNGFTWVLVGGAPGSTKLHFYRDDDEVDTLTVDVIAQEP